MHKLLSQITDRIYPIEKIHFYLLACIAIIYVLTIKMGIIPAILFASIPALVICLMLFLHKPLYTLIAFFVLSYLVMGISRYYSFKAGMLMSILAGGVLFIVLLQNLWQRSDWKRCRNLLTVLWGFWFIYCFLELANSEALLEPWTIAITMHAFYPLLFAILVPVMFTRFNHMKWLMIIWAVLTILAAAKGYWQKNHGFDPTELNWLTSRGAHTHLIYSGIRYFSFFTDAANFGCSMGLSLTIFGLAGFYIKKKQIKILFWIAALAGGYGMMISGTRTAFVIPLIGLAVYLVLCRNFRHILIGIMVLAGTVVVLKYTEIGNSNRLIRRMRTVFDLKDASMLVRSTNKQKLWNYIKDKPFGVGIGLGGGNAGRFKPHSPIAQIPTDSWLVLVLVETGYVGLIFYLTIILMILYKGMHIAVKEIQNKELKGILIAILSGISGIFVASYANEVLGLPNGIIVFFLLGLIFAAKYYDHELSTHGQAS